MMKYGRSALRNMKTILMREHSRTEVDTTLKKAKKISTEKLETYLKFVGSMVLCESEKIVQAGEALESLQADFNEIIAQYEAILKDLNVQDTIDEAENEIDELYNTVVDKDKKIDDKQIDEPLAASSLDRRSANVTRRVQKVVKVSVHEGNNQIHGRKSCENDSMIAFVNVTQRTSLL